MKSTWRRTNSVNAGSERRSAQARSSCESVWSFTHPIVAAACQTGQGKEKILSDGAHFCRDIAAKVCATGKRANCD
jgi:hypothetical protein